MGAALPRLHPRAHTAVFPLSRPVVCSLHHRCTRVNTATQAAVALRMPWTPLDPQYVTQPQQIRTAPARLTRVASATAMQEVVLQDQGQAATILPTSWTSARLVKHPDPRIISSCNSTQAQSQVLVIYLMACRMRTNRVMVSRLLWAQAVLEVSTFLQVAATTSKGQVDYGLLGMGEAA